MKTVITYGTFDLFHVGHVRLLERAKMLGERLIVGVSTDDFNEMKGKRTIFSYEDRAKIVGAMKFVDHVFPETSWEQKPIDIERFGANIFVMGSDWTGKFDDLKQHCELVYLPRTHGISSTKVKSTLSALRSDRVKEIHAAISALQSIVQQLGD